MLVNQWNPIDRNYEIDLIELNNGHSIDRRAYPDLQDMMDDARAEGLKPILCSSYRSNQKQRDLFANQVNKYLAYGMTEEEAEAEAAKWVAIPGTSEHHTGLAVDIVALDYQLLDEGQQNTPEQQWLRENSYKYGYILRYPPDKSDLTGINFETWHYRYVGKEAAKEIYEKGICLEEYLADYMN
ncbi:MAG: M15 family metallopeptidase [Clostridia bacterium]|nr:M15 family metallopeptidase [Clostridia bacterium]